MILIVITGGGNLLVTKQSEQISRLDMDRAFKQLDDLHGELRSWIERQKEIYEYIKTLKRNP